MRLTIKASEHQDGMRIDSFIAANSELSRAAVQRLLEQQQVLCDGKAVIKSHKVKDGQCFEVTVPDPEPCEVYPQDIPLDIVYEDDCLAVINKARGMVVHPAAGNPDGTVVNALLHHCKDTLSGIGGQLRPGIVHRLDKDTSGLLIVAKDDNSHRLLSAQLADRTLSRHYHAVVFGTLKQQTGVIDAPIGRSAKDRKKMAVVPGGKPAITDWSVLTHYSGYTYIKCALRSGRTHQIRVHMAHIGHPVVGDPLYGRAHDKSGLGGQCLHAAYLRFVHPKSGQQIELNCPLPDYFTDFLRRIDR